MTSGGSGGTSGLRYNPRETAGDELGYGVSHTAYNPRDSDEKQNDLDDKRDKREKRDRAKAGIQHLKVKVKNVKRELNEAQKETGELSDLTGPAGSRGGDLDNAVGTMTGTGSAMGGGVGAVPPELPGTGNFGQGGAFVRAFDVLKREDTETLESTRSKLRGGKAKRHKKHGFVESHRRQRGGKRLNVSFRDPKKRAGSHVRHRVHYNPRHGAIRPRVTGPLFRGVGGRRAHIAMPDPRQREARLTQRYMSQEMPQALPYTAPMRPMTPTATPQRYGRPRSKRGDDRPSALLGPKQIKQPRTASTPMGAGFGTGGTSPLALSEDVMELDGLLLKFFAGKAKIRQADVAEFKQLLRDAKRLLSQLKKGYDVGCGDDAEGPSPRGHNKQTSDPKGATESDPEDDATTWGAHSYGIVARRGQP